MVYFKSITSPQNSLLKAAVKLRTRRGREQQQRIIIDGAREVTRALIGGVSVERLFLPETINPAVPENGWPEWIDANCLQHTSPSIQQEVRERLDPLEIVSLGTPLLRKVGYGDRGDIVAVAIPPRRTLNEIPISNRTVIGILDRLEKPGNVGAIMRSADGAGLDGVILIDGETDLYNPNAIRASLGTIFTVVAVEATFDAFARWLDETQVTWMHYLARLDEAVDYQQVEFQYPAGVVFGSEATGISSRWLDLPHQSIRIPMRGIADSLNVSASAAVLFYAARR